MSEMAPLWSALVEVDQRAGILSTRLPLLSVSKSQGIIRYEDLFPERMIRAEDLSHYKVVERGQIVLNKMSAATGAVGRANERGLISPDYAVFDHSSDSDSGYLAHLLGSDGFCKNEIKPRLQGIGVGDVSNARTPRVSITSYLSPFVYLPPLETQRRIADYLDREISQIDAMIDKLGELAHQLRLRANRAADETIFTDSKLASLGYAVNCLPGFAFKSSKFSHNDEDIPLLRGVNVKPDGLDWTETVYWPHEMADGLEEYFLRSGDIVLGMDRPFIGSGTRVVQIEDSDPKSLLVQRVLRLRVLEGTNTRYIYHALKSKTFEAYVTPETTGISVPHISETQVRDFRIPLPPLEEQRRIADHLDDVTSKIDAMLAKVAQLKDLLTERRAALITDMVTGRKDVA